MNLCFQVEGYVSPFANQLPKVQTEDLIYIEKFEEDAYGHWFAHTLWNHGRNGKDWINRRG